MTSYRKKKKTRILLENKGKWKKVDIGKIRVEIVD